jgi:ribose transport system ATP-binding protein
MRIATPGHTTRLENLSGGNQQKVVFAKWLNRKDRILILDEPTRGVDVGAKLEIGTLIKERADQGTSTLLISSEIEEIVNLSDRVLVLKEGRIVGDVSGEEINNATLMRYALGEESIDA